MEPTKKLFRSRINRQIAGVCGGLGEFFGIDPVIVRVLFIIGTIMGGPGLLLYIILALVMPENTQEEAHQADF